MFFFNDTAATEIYTLSLHDALPISVPLPGSCPMRNPSRLSTDRKARDRKSTRMNSSHSQISYAVFCLKKKHLEHSCEPAQSTRLAASSSLAYVSMYAVPSSSSVPVL